MGKFSYIMSCGKAINYFGTYGGHINVFWIKWTFPIKLWKKPTQMCSLTLEVKDHGQVSGQDGQSTAQFASFWIGFRGELRWQSALQWPPLGLFRVPHALELWLRTVWTKQLPLRRTTTVSLVWFAWLFQAEPTHPPPPLLQPLHGLHWVSDSWTFLTTALWRGLLIY